VRVLIAANVRANPVPPLGRGEKWHQESQSLRLRPRQLEPETYQILAREECPDAIRVITRSVLRREVLALSHRHVRTSSHGRVFPE
jgi:hypothetical protein